MDRIVLIGAGGHGAMVLEAVRAEGIVEPVAFVDIAERVGEDVLGLPVHYTEADLAALATDGVTGFIVTVGSVGDPAIRRRLYERALAAGLEPATVVHPSAVVSPSAQLGVGTFVGPLAHVGARAEVGECSILNSCSSIDHDCRIGAFCHIAPGAVLSGTVRVGSDTHVGNGATISHGVTVGPGAVIGAGAVVVSELPGGVVAFGNPARVQREVGE